MMLLLNTIPQGFSKSSRCCSQLLSFGRWNQPRFLQYCIMGQNTRSQGLARFEFNMAAHSVRIPQKNSAFLHNSQPCHELKSTQISFGEVHNYSKLFYYYRVAK